MRTTLNLDDELLNDAREFTGIQEKTALIHEALRRLVVEEAGKGLAAMGGTMPDFWIKGYPLPKKKRKKQR